MIKVIRRRFLVERPWNKFQECVQYGTYLLSPYGVSFRRQKLVPLYLLLLNILTRKVILHRQNTTKKNVFFGLCLQIQVSSLSCRFRGHERELHFYFCDSGYAILLLIHQNLNEFEFEQNSEVFFPPSKRLTNRLRLSNLRYSYVSRVP
jgi:hypothetical protein